MFDFLVVFISKSIFTQSVALIFQVGLFYAIYMSANVKTVLWQSVCKNLSLFLIMQTTTQLLYSLDLEYLHVPVPMLIKVGILLISSIPLFVLWINIPDLLLNSKKNRTSNPEFSHLNISEEKKEHSEVTLRLLRSLKRIDKTVSINL